MHVAVTTTQKRHCHASIEEPERCASPVDRWLMTPLPQEIVMGNQHVAETATVATASAAAAAAAAAVTAAAVKMLLQNAGMNAW